MTNLSSTTPEIHLYYLDNSKVASLVTVFELTWTPQNGWGEATETGAVAYNTYSPLATTLVQASPSSSLEIHLFFTNIFLGVGTLIRNTTSSRWGIGLPLFLYFSITNAWVNHEANNRSHNRIHRRRKRSKCRGTPKLVHVGSVQHTSQHHHIILLHLFQ